MEIDVAQVMPMMPVLRQWSADNQQVPLARAS